MVPERLWPLFIQFWQTRAWQFRAAVAILVLWPLAIVFTARQGSEAWTLTVAMIPLVAGGLWLFFVFDPLLAKLVTEHDALKRFGQMLSKVIGLEMALGLFLTLAPPNKDGVLIALVVFAWLTWFFLRIGDGARLVRIAVFWVAVYFSVAMGVGGRQALRDRWNAWRNPPPVPERKVVYPSQMPPRPVAAVQPTQPPPPRRATNAPAIMNVTCGRDFVMVPPPPLSGAFGIAVPSERCWTEWVFIDRAQKGRCETTAEVIAELLQVDTSRLTHRLATNNPISVPARIDAIRFFNSSGRAAFISCERY